MKYLYICRHAKSNQEVPNVKDFDRPLNERGLKDAPQMAEFLLEKNISFDLIISSPALRAKTTAVIYADKLGYKKDEIQLEQRIYEADINDLVDIFKLIPDNNNHVAIFGHNPTFTYLIEYLTEYEIENLPTCGIACIEINTDHWSQVNSQINKVSFLIFPKMLRD
ncbi:MAG: histidine phosphatase family protein [Bacteroidota bacterium]